MNGPEITSDDIPGGAGSLLFFDNGVPSTIEVFAYGDFFPDEGPRLFELWQAPPNRDS